MYILITYDVNTASEGGQKRLRQVAKCCQNYGQRVQNSVFECLVDSATLTMIKNKLFNIIQPDTDTIRIYRLGNHYQRKIEKLGKETSFDIEGELII